MRKIYACIFLALSVCLLADSQLETLRKINQQITNEGFSQAYQSVRNAQNEWPEEVAMNSLMPIQYWESRSICFLSQRQYGEALGTLEKELHCAIPIFGETDSVVINLYYQLAQYYVQTKDLAKAKLYIGKAKEAMLKSKAGSKDAYQRLEKVNSQINQNNNSTGFTYDKNAFDSHNNLLLKKK